MQRFLTGHPKYQQLMQSLKQLPEHLLPKGRRVPNPLSASPNAAARHFRKAFSLPYDKWNSARYFSTIGRQLNGKVQLLKGVGRHATWYIPAAFGLYNVVQAPAEMKMRTLFEEGFGVLSGALGAHGGMLAGIGIATFLCFGPFGIFVTVFICASAAGIWANGLGKTVGGELIYDYGSQFGEQIFHSFDEILESH